MKHQDKLESWAMREFPRAARDAIIQLDPHSVIAFARYRITRQQGRYCVDTGSSEHRFGSSKSAMTWCILDRLGRQDWCIHLENLDQRRVRLTEDIAAREHVIARSHSTAFRDAASDKLWAKRSSLAVITAQLDKYADRAKYFQHQGFANETARTRRT